MSLPPRPPVLMRQNAISLAPSTPDLNGIARILQTLGFQEGTTIEVLQNGQWTSVGSGPFLSDRDYFVFRNGKLENLFDSMDCE